MSKNVLLSLSVSMFVYILLTIYLKNNKNIVPLSIVVGLFVYILSFCFIGSTSFANNLPELKKRLEETSDKDLEDNNVDKQIEHS